MGFKLRLKAIVSCDEPSCSDFTEFSEDMESVSPHQFGGIAKDEILKTGWSHEVGFGWRCQTHTHWPNMDDCEIDEAIDSMQDIEE